MVYVSIVNQFVCMQYYCKSIIFNKKLVFLLIKIVVGKNTKYIVLYDYLATSLTQKIYYSAKPYFYAIALVLFHVPLLLVYLTKESVLHYTCMYYFVIR